MTTDEFHSHLMAALHGPHAMEIAERIGVLLVEAMHDPGTRESAISAADAFLGAALGDTIEAIAELLMLAHLSSLDLRHSSDVSQAIRVSSARARIEECLRVRLRERLSHGDPGTSKSVAAKIFLAMEPTP